ncbi:MAG: sugar ABC transporter permease [Acidobacteria bacterium]|nr:MAG: sugar ABC transporter permease [Acidobacteriota bacterium]REJ98684.1 MAG: sugar ABC transporter permease [Acidobacteriota bacterium]REK16660.1 MAG: sugar ABC transporter permease [Acidobacteriota bacterium]REK42571.1 MAG: sugar ABC transporter permease [Acidobacteriota bacterium]
MEIKAKTGRIKIRTSALRAYTMVGSLVLIWLFFHWQTGSIFLTPRNLSNLMLQTSVTGIIAIGMLMVIVSGNIDLSVGSMLALAGGVGAICLTNLGYGLVPSLLIAIAVGLAIGFLQGFLTAYASIPAFIVTLGGLLAWRGAIKGISESETIPVTDASFKAIGQNYLAPELGWVLAAIAIGLVLYAAVRRSKVKKEYGLEEGRIGTELLKAFLPIAGIVGFILVMNAYAGIPVPVLIFLAVALVGLFITTNTTFGRYIYAIGGNAEAARLSGINNKAVVMMVFAILGAFTGIAALIYTARVASASPDAGSLLELDAIAACVIGGTSLMGGRGTVFGACLGALIMSSLDNGMSLLNLQDYVQELIKGSILVAAVGVDMVGAK